MDKHYDPNIGISDVKNPSSSNVESSFKTSKRCVFDIATKSSRLRVDEFVMKHLEYIAGERKKGEKETKDRKNNKRRFR
jgi:hypothetical protein